MNCLVPWASTLGARVPASFGFEAIGTSPKAPCLKRISLKVLSSFHLRRSVGIWHASSKCFTYTCKSLQGPSNSSTPIASLRRISRVNKMKSSAQRRVSSFLRCVLRSLSLPSDRRSTIPAGSKRVSECGNKVAQRYRTSQVSICTGYMGNFA